MKNRFRTIKALAAIMGIGAMLSAVPAYADSIHVAEEGNTFYTLSKKYNVDMNQLMKANPTIDALNIYEGLNITIPGKVETQSD